MIHHGSEDPFAHNIINEKMAENKHTKIQAAVFKTNMNTNYEVNYDIKRNKDKNFAKLVTKPESTAFHLRSNPNHISSDLKDVRKNGRKMKPSRMLIYEDCSEEEKEEKEPFRSTPPNIQDRSIIETPGAPIKSRKELEKKLLRPKKLVYNDRDNDNTEDLGNEDDNNLFYHSTPKNTERKYEGDGDFYYGKLINFSAIIPRKIVPIREEDDGLSVYPTNQEFDLASEREIRNVQQDSNKSNIKGNRKKKLNNEARKSRKASSRSRIAKNDFNCNKENDVRLFGTENDLEDAEFNSELLSKNKSTKNTDRNREELMNLSKIGKLTHFRM